MGLEMVSGSSRLLEGEQSRDFQGGSSSPDLPTLLSLPSLVRTADEAPIMLAWVGPRRETGPRTGYPIQGARSSGISAFRSSGL